MSINKKKIYLYGFNSEQLKIIKNKNKNALFIDENKITEKINSMSCYHCSQLENQLRLR